MRYKIIVIKHGIGWYKNDRWYRENGPAWFSAHGNRSWYKDGKYHRLDGPAIEWTDGRKFWCIDDIRYTEEEFLKISPACSTM